MVSRRKSSQLPPLLRQVCLRHTVQPLITVQELQISFDSDQTKRPSR